MRKDAYAKGMWLVTVGLETDSMGVRVTHGAVMGLEDWNRWSGEMEPDTQLMVGGRLSYSAEHLAGVISKPTAHRFTDDIVPIIYGGIHETRCESLEAAVGAALYDMLQVHEVEDGVGYLIDGDLFKLEPPQGQEMVTRPCWYIVADGVHVADTRDVKPEYLRELLGERHLPEWAMGTRWTERRREARAC